MTKILVVDDIEENRYFLATLLQGHGYAVESATNGAEALALAHAAPPELIITDILMPMIDGFELCRVCKRDARLGHVPIVVYTATYSDPKDERLAMSLGAQRFLIKPQPHEMLLQVVREVLAEAARGAVAKPTGDETELLRQHNDTLVQKLAKKVGELEAELARRAVLQTAIAESTDLLRIAGRMARIGGWNIDVAGARVRYSSEVADLLELPADAPLSIAEGMARFAPAWREQATAAFERCVRDGTPYDLEVELATTTGAPRWVRAIGEAVKDASGATVRVHGALQDITERKEAEHERQRLHDALVHSQRIESIGRLAGGVAHDFNNLLSVILAYTNFALEGLRDGDPMRADFEEIKKAGERAAALTRQLLAFSRKQILEPKVVDLNQVVTNLEPMLRRLVREDIEIELELSEALGRVLIDPGQLEQVIVNLVVNARDAMARGGRLCLGTAEVETELGRSVVLSVADTGSGMDAATQRRIFEPFFTTKGDQGTGLGLATAHGIVAQSGGTITVVSELGRGTTFRVALPRVDVVATAVEARALPALATGSETVLVVEDEPSLRTIVERILRRAGYMVFVAANAGEALLICEKLQGHVALVVTDVVMPQMSGCELVRRLTKAHPTLRALYMSGYFDAAIELDVPRDALIAKPFSTTELARKVREVLDADPGMLHAF